MGRVISIDGWLEAHERSRSESADADVARLERAVARLEPLLARAGRARAAVDLETELLAVSGAVSLGRYQEAARRAERLADRLSSARLQRG
jgi:hypothetical protein